MPREESATPAVAWRSRLEAAWQARQYRVSGTRASVASLICDPHCSQRPNVPAASRASASSTSASRRRAATARRMSRSAPSPRTLALAGATAW